MRTILMASVMLVALALAGCADTDESGDGTFDEAFNNSTTETPSSSGLCLEGTVCDDTPPGPPGNAGEG